MNSQSQLTIHNEGKSDVNKYNKIESQPKSDNRKLINIVEI